jgi:integrase
VSTGKENKREANDWLRDRLLEAKQGLAMPHDKVTIQELVTELFKQYDVDGRKTKDDDERRWKLHLKPFFGACKAMDVTRAMIRQYIAERKTQKDFHDNFPKNATINRELSILREAYNLAVTDERLRHMPSFKKLLLDESGNVRRGFLKDNQYEALARETSAIGLWLRAMFEIYYAYGWRRSEPLENVSVRLLDFEHRTISIEHSKNGEGRTVKMTQKVFELLKACCEGKGENDFVFTREGGNVVKDFRESWKKATMAAGVPGLLVHDLRRTGARNMRRAGVDRDVIMKIGGWKTDSVFRRYNIVDEADLHEAATALDKKRETSQLSHNLPAKEKQPDSKQTQDATIQ